MNRDLEARVIDRDEDTMASLDADHYKDEELLHAKQWIVKWGSVLSVIFLVLWPVLTIPAFAFGESYFYFWVVLSILWGIVATTVSIALPLVEGRQGIYNSLHGLMTNPPGCGEMYKAVTCCVLSKTLPGSHVADAIRGRIKRKEKTIDSTSSVGSEAAPAHNNPENGSADSAEAEATVLNASIVGDEELAELTA
jgi:hypothetical protein